MRSYGHPGRSQGAHASDQQYVPGSTLQCTVAYNEYGGYCVPLSSVHRPAAKRILRHQVYEPETIKLIASQCAEDDVVHAGAFFGDFLPALSAACSIRAKVWAFEPNPESYRCARITIELNQLSNVELINAALGAKASWLPLRTADPDGLALGGASRIVSGEPAEGDEMVSVRVVTVDETVGDEKHVSVIHLDVEGYEREALEGAVRTLRRCRPVLILERLPNSKLLEDAWFVETVSSLDYEITTAVHGNVVYMPRVQSQRRHR